MSSAQTNIQIQYDAGSDRGYVTTTLEGFYNDSWGNTFFFVDHDFNARGSLGQVIWRHLYRNRQMPEFLAGQPRSTFESSGGVQRRRV